MGNRRDRMKASEVFTNTNYIFSQKVPFEEAFPQIEDVKVEIEEGGHGIYSEFRNRFRTKGSLGEYIDCSNPLCYNGGFSIGEILREMVRAKQSDLETSKLCQGYEGSPKGRRRYRRCMNFFKIKVQIKFKETDKNIEEGD